MQSFRSAWRYYVQAPSHVSAEERQSLAFRCNRLAALTDLYFSALEWAVHHAGNWQLDEKSRTYALGDFSLWALGIETIDDVLKNGWLGTAHFRRDSTPPFSGGHIDLELLYGDDALMPPDCSASDRVHLVRFPDDIDAMPCETIRTCLYLAFVNLEQDLKSEGIHWQGPPHFKHASCARQLLDDAIARHTELKVLLCDLNEARLNFIADIEKVLRADAQQRAALSIGSGEVGSLRRLVEAIAAAKGEIDLARQQSIKPKHLSIRMRRAAVKAARAVASAVKTELGSIVPWNSIHAALRLFETDGSIDAAARDNAALTFWMFSVCPALRSRHSEKMADAGAYDFPKIKTDEHGRALGRDGKIPQVVDIIDPTTGETIGQTLDGKIARVTDDYSEADALEHLRCQAADWAEACQIAIDQMQRSISTASEAKGKVATIAELQTDVIFDDIERAQKGDREARHRLATKGIGIAGEVPEPFAARVVDTWGERTLVVPGKKVDLMQPRWTEEDVQSMVLDIEARTNTRLKDGGNPLWLMILHTRFKEDRDQHTTISFADYCVRRYPDKIDYAPFKADANSPSSESCQPAGQSATDKLVAPDAAELDREKQVTPDVKELLECEKLAFFAITYAEGKLERSLTVAEAHEWLIENGTAEAGGELENYELPSLDTFTSYCSRARKKTGTQKYEKRRGRTGRSVVPASKLERRAGN